MHEAMQTANEVWAAAMVVGAYAASLGAIVLILVAEAWVGWNMIRGWRAGRSGWGAMVASFADAVDPHGETRQRPTLVDGQPLQLDRGRDGLVPVEGGRR